MVKNEFIKQYDHVWNVLKRLVSDFDDDAWVNQGIGYMAPARIAYHILISTKYYLADDSVMQFPSGKPFGGNTISMSNDELPSRPDILQVLEVFREKTEQWLSALDFGAKNEAFNWAGETQAGVVIFLLKHSMYHLGEVGALLYQSKSGNVEDHYVKAI
ncbi:MAG: DinB family protein [Anaerolineae bacterium]|nr:DinB family protein [Anaerolineae bacterium]